MKTENSVLMKQAREALSGKWGLAIWAFFLYFLITLIIQNIPKVGSFIPLFISGPMALGFAIFSLSISRNQNPKLEQIFEGFKRFGTSLVAFILMSLFTLLWTLLLIVPGIIASLSYSMTFYIIADHSSMGAIETIKRSKKMMYGFKWKYLELQLRFLGWALLSILTLGIGLLWLVPYMSISNAKFYEDIKIVNLTPVF